MRFAGSRCLDERRRRRLAGEADDHVLPAQPAAAYDGEATTADGDSAALPPEAAPVSHFPLGRLISRKLWKLWAVGLLLLLAGANVLLAGSAVGTAPARLGPGFVYLFDLTAGRIVKPLATLLLLLSTQLAWFIWWVRSRSPRDFAGRYRAWGWCTALFGFGTLAVATDLHRAWTQTVLWLWDVDLWNRERVVWLLPVSLAALGALRILRREMRDCRSSLTLLWMAALGGLSALVLNLHVVRMPLPADQIRLLHWSAELAACWLLFMSLLLHARHVIHVTADPAQIRPAKLKLRSLLRWPKLPARRTKAPPAAAEAASPVMATAVKEAKSSDTSTPSKPKKAAPRQDKAAVKEKPAAKEPPEPAKAVAERAEEPEGSSMSDEAADDADCSPASQTAPSPKGLSKRERRRLRKQQRESRSQGRAA